MTGLVAHISYRQYGVPPQLALNTYTVLVDGRQPIIACSQTCETAYRDRAHRCRARRQGKPRVRERYVSEAHALAEGYVAGGVVHVVALFALEHDAEAAAHDGLARAGEIISKADTRTESVPVVLDQPGGGAVLSDDANSIEVEHVAQRSEDGIGTSSESAGGGQGGVDVARSCKDRRVGGVPQVGVEVRITAVTLGRMRDSIPSQAKIQSQPAGRPPVVLNIGSPGNVRPMTAVLERYFAVAAGHAQQVIGKRGPGESAVEGIFTFRGAEGLLHFRVPRPATAELELVRSLYPGQIVADLIIGGLIGPGGLGNVVICDAADGDAGIPCLDVRHQIEESRN